MQHRRLLATSTMLASFQLATKLAAATCEQTLRCLLVHPGVHRVMWLLHPSISTSPATFALSRDPISVFPHAFVPTSQPPAAAAATGRATLLTA